MLPERVQNYARRPYRAVDTLRQPGETRPDRGTWRSRRSGRWRFPSRTAPPTASPHGKRQGGRGLEAVQQKLVIAETIQQTHQYAETGIVDAAIATSALSVPALRAASRPLRGCSPGIATPLDQALAVIKGTKNEAAARALARL